MSKKPAISVIIPAHNEEKYIHRPLNSLKKQTFKDFEMIVLADSCTDKTNEIAKKYGCRVKKTDTKNVGINRNIGAKLAKADILVFLDADVRVSENYLEKVIETYNRGFNSGKPFYFTDCRNIIGKYFFLTLNLPLVRNFPNSFFVHKKYYEKVGGFSERYNNCMDDVEFPERLSKLIRIKQLKAKVYNSDRRIKEIGILGEIKLQLIGIWQYFVLMKIFGKKPTLEWPVHR